MIYVSGKGKIKMSGYKFYHIGYIGIDNHIEKFEADHGIHVEEGMTYTQLIDQLSKLIKAQGGVEINKTTGYFGSYWITVDIDKTKLNLSNIREALRGYEAYFDFKPKDEKIHTSEWGHDYKIFISFDVADEEDFRKAKEITYADINEQHLADILNILLTGRELL